MAEIIVPLWALSGLYAWAYIMWMDNGWTDWEAYMLIIPAIFCGPFVWVIVWWSHK